MEERIETTINPDETLMTSMTLITPYCSGNQPATFICLTEGCTDNAMMCDNVGCNCKDAKHDKCTTKITIK